ncbi:MAG: hypothetical protein MJ016_03570 [Victivallaceae bacterium]|nr:hypothetical protein [Victivallaceae bacterium]
MKKSIFAILVVCLAANVFGRSRDMQNAFDIMSLINRGISTVDHADRVTDRHYYRMSKYYPPMMPVYAAQVPAVAAPVAQPVMQPVAAPVMQPVAAPVVQPVAAPVVQPVAQPVIVQPVRMYPLRRPWHYQTPGHIPPQRGVVYAQ